MYNGCINVYKEKGYTSFDVVAKLRGILKQKKIGHTGTLDPEACGVLPVCLGIGTKLCDVLTDKDKVYLAELVLGTVTDTQDLTGSVLETCGEYPEEDAVREAIASFVGKIEQIPPMYSAIKVNGKKLYELARQGKTVERKARAITVYSIDIVKIELPVVTIRVYCSKGTYIRTLCHDIGQKLGCGGCMGSLLRERVGRFSLDEALTLSEIEALVKDGTVGTRIIPVDALLSDYPAVRVTDDYDRAVKNGNAIPAELAGACSAYPEKLRVYDASGSFVGLYRLSGPIYKPEKMFLQHE